MPGISDPGSWLAAAAIAAGVPVIPIPGANAAITALVASGLPAGEFQFLGFLPEKGGQRRTRLEQIAADAGDEARTLIFYEAPHRILETLADLEAVFGAELRIVLARELTKVHEEFLRGTVAQVRQSLSERDRMRGEMTLLVQVPPAVARSAAGPERISDRVAQLEATGLDEKDALKQLARELNRSKSDIYRELQRERASRRPR
jgi:16S rRNA (cytidine1402-2'-O)-methyltransferase